jgi:enoyl-CoA hydratase/carnithine racemase
MGTEKQIQVNRENALKSTGPRTATGKLVSSRNATRHGFYSKSVVLPHEDEDEFLRLARRLAGAYNACGVREEELLKTVIETHWQLRRTTLVDSELFQIYGFYKGQNRGVGTAFAQDSTQGNAFSKLTRYQAFLR